MSTDSKTPLSLFERVWPATFITISLIAVLTWTGIIGYGVFRLGALAF
jgi:hypothetical protein